MGSDVACNLKAGNRFLSDGKGDSPLCGWWVGEEVGLSSLWYNHKCVRVCVWSGKAGVSVLSLSEPPACWPWAGCFECL